MPGSKFVIGFVVAALMMQYLTSPPLPSANAVTQQAYVGVNFHGYNVERTTFALPPNYFDDSFKLISQGGMNSIRLLYFWQSYNSNSTAFMAELQLVAQTAQKYNLKVLYDFHKYHTSSWLDCQHGLGYPSTLFESNPQRYPQCSGGAKDNTSAVWWEDWLNRQVKDIYGHDGWALQARFMKKVVFAVDSYSSTLGYEIVSEPMISNSTDWSKLSTFNTYIETQLRMVTQKEIFYCNPILFSINGTISRTPSDMASMAPANKTNVVFDGHLYSLPSQGSYGAKKLNDYVQAASLAGVPLYIGEWNNGTALTSDISQSNVDVFITAFNSVKVYGWAYYGWSAHNNIALPPSYNLINATSTGIQPTKYYYYLSCALVQVCM